MFQSLTMFPQLSLIPSAGLTYLLDLDLTFCGRDLAGSVLCVSVFDNVSSVVSDSFCWTDLPVRS